MGSSRRGAHTEVRKCANRQTVFSLICPEDHVVARASSRRNEVDQTYEDVYAIRANGVCGIGAVEGLVTQGRDRRVTESPSTRTPSAALPRAFTAPPLLVVVEILTFLINYLLWPQHKKPQRIKVCVVRVVLAKFLNHDL